MQPGEPRTLPIRLALCLRIDGPDAAVAELGKLLAEHPHLSSETLLRLAEVCEKHAMPAAAREQVLRQYEKQHGQGPTLAYIRALETAQRDGGPADFNDLLFRRLDGTLDIYLAAARQVQDAPVEASKRT